jgi:pyruvate dehydrogenase E2 component (dihydrolipoamide acetyltransferase)
MATETGRGDVSYEDPSRLQRNLVRRVAESKATAPDLVLSHEVDMEAALALGHAVEHVVVKAAALALRDVPRVNGAYRDGRFERYGRVNIGLVVDAQGALVVPTILDADSRPLDDIAADASRLAERARDGSITPPELASPTFTVYCLPVKRFTAVLPTGQGAILAVGEPTPRPVVRDGAVTIRRTSELTLTCDHRLLYGPEAAAFLRAVDAHLQAL